jgi:hypothetical protein
MRALLLTAVVLVGLLGPDPVAAQVGPVPEHGPTEVVGGEPAEPGEDPWMAALVLDEDYMANPFAGLVCGASFISPDTVVTAAHCVEGAGPSDVDVVVGSINLLPAEVERLAVRNIRVHPGRRGDTDLYDVAAVQLVVPPSVPVTPIDLVAPADAPLWEPGDTARFTGWGEDERGQPISRLQEAEAPIVADPDCEARYGAFFWGTTMLCVGDLGPGGGDVSPCFGDSGGPLTVLDGGRPVLVGLVLGGFRCGDPNYPAVFTEVDAVRPFLRPYLDPDTVPGLVQDLHAVRRGAEGKILRVSWRPPLFDGGTAVTYHVITVEPGNRRIVVGPSPGTDGGFDHQRERAEVRIRNVAGDRALTVTVAAKNAVGIGPARAFRVPA